ncbi:MULTISPECIES: hypothetical protein [unclassified Moorena]|uniref:hypothetical protein n=1 Tax=unclassified Moorena TaxID=2683338 RepID=UPI0013C2987E|nr:MULTISPECIES: hypothetical protein [unclassified Moorena]NEO08069.1 hypothetical protein [Moorena sp. SIO3I8]NEO19840.1 hypothetical protein [Moorena sp. SIO4A5]NEO48404.1 hypothetical protein [Moorena sp. SIO4A3]NEQ57093.1 hypothetical protein [Moorena sp. SIO4A1]
MPIIDVNKLSEHHFIRHAVLPGITGLLQVSGRSDITSCLDAVAHGAWVCVRNLRPHRCLPRGNPLFPCCIALKKWYI